MARQADGTVLATYGETTVLATAVAARTAKPGIDFFPLTEYYQKDIRRRTKFFRRLFQARRPPTERENADLTPDRPADPAILFVEGFRTDTQVIIHRALL